MKTIKELKEAGKFVVEEWMGVVRFEGITTLGSGHSVCKYNFEYDQDCEKLYVSGHVFGQDKVEVLKPEETLFNIGREEYTPQAMIITNTGVSFWIRNPRIRFLEAQ